MLEPQISGVRRCNSTTRSIRFLFFIFFFFYIGLARQSVQGLRSFYSRYCRSERLMQRVGFKYFTAICRSHREGPTGAVLARKIHANRIYVDQLFPGALERNFAVSIFAILPTRSRSRSPTTRPKLNIVSRSSNFSDR